MKGKILFFLFIAVIVTVGFLYREIAKTDFGRGTLVTGDQNGQEQAQSDEISGQSQGNGTITNSNKETAEGTVPNALPMQNSSGTLLNHGSLGGGSEGATSEETPSLGLSEFQEIACQTANEVNVCDTKLEELGIVSKEDCCEKMGLCC